MNLNKTVLLAIAGLGLGIGASLEVSALWGSNDYCAAQCHRDKGVCMDNAGNDPQKQGQCHEQYRDCVNLCQGGWMD